ncbi:MAG: hypothetical protein IPL88_01085 [Rhizobiales bacterium]|nr:hypothetical protein [Hyphomicrobiales bacterium]
MSALTLGHRKPGSGERAATPDPGLRLLALRSLDAPALLAGLLAGLALFLVASPPPLPLLRYGGDWLALLDAAHRLDLGQRPHVDFHSPFGPIPLALAWASTHLADAARAFWTMQGLQWFALAPFGLAAAAAQAGTWRRLAVLVGFSLPLFVPYVMDYDALREFNGNGIYNRFCTAGLFVLVAGLVAQKRVSAGWTVWLGGLLALLAFTKITAALAAAPIVAAFALASPVARRLALRAALGVALVAALLQLASGLTLAYAQDVAEMARLNRGKGLYFMATLTLRSWPGALAVAALAFVWLAQLDLRRVSDPSPWRASLRRARPVLALLAICAAAIFAESQNTGALNLYIVPALALMPMRRDLGAAPATRAALAATVALCLTPILENMVRRGFHFAMTDTRAMTREASLGPALPGLRVTAATSALARELAEDWRARAADGRSQETALLAARSNEPAHSLAQLRLMEEAARIARARGLVGAATRTTTINLVDVATRMAGATPAPGMKLWLDPVRTFGPMTREEAQAYLAPAEAAFQPVCGVSEEMAAIAERLTPGLVVDFAPTRLTDCVTLWLRKPGARGRVSAL